MGVPDESTKVFRSKAHPFTFEYPASFVAGTVDAVGLKKRIPAVGLDGLNLIIVRNAGARIPDAQLEPIVRALLKKLKAEPQSVRREQHSKLAMIVAKVPSRVDGKATISALYFFSGGGGTWELECQSTRERRQQLDRGCAIAVNSLRFP